MSEPANPKKQRFDAIVVGSGMSGGWAAKELCENGLKTLVLERGRDIAHSEGYPTANSVPWELQYLNRPSQQMLAEQEKQNRTGYTVRPASAHFSSTTRSTPA